MALVAYISLERLTGVREEGRQPPLRPGFARRRPEASGREQVARRFPHQWLDDVPSDGATVGCHVRVAVLPAVAAGVVHHQYTTDRCDAQLRLPQGAVPSAPHLAHQAECSDSHRADWD